MQENKVIVIAGPTASGKSALAIDLALALNGVVINADSMQVYKDMPIVSAVPTAEDKAKVEHRLYEIYDPSFRGNVVDWLKSAVTEIRDVWSQGKTPVVVGGTGLYLENLIKGMTPIPATPEDIRQKVQKMIDTEGWQPCIKNWRKLIRSQVKKLLKTMRPALNAHMKCFCTRGSRCLFGRKNRLFKICRKLNFL